MVLGQIFQYIGPHSGPRKYRMELSFINESFFTHGTVNCSIKLAIKFMGSHWELTILGIQKIPKSAKISHSKTSKAPLHKCTKPMEH